MTPQLVAITGGSGSGKTWLADRIAAALGDKAARLSLDDFYQDRSHLTLARRKRINFDHPRAIDWPLFAAALRDLAGGRSATVPVYDFTLSTRADRVSHCEPRPWLIIDGLWLLAKPAVRRLFQHRIYLHCPTATRYERRLARDRVERGRTAESVHHQFYGHVEPMHQLFVEPQRRHARLILDPPVTADTISSILQTLRADTP